jgi:hypothetical protein
MRKRAETMLHNAGYYRTWTHNEGNPPATVATLADFAAQNPGLDPRDYGFDPPYSSPDWHQGYMSDSRTCTSQYQAVKEALRECYLTDVTDQHVIDAAPQAFSGRLEVTQEGDSVKLDYTPGQYQPTEFRAATAAVLFRAATLAQQERAAA